MDPKIEIIKTILSASHTAPRLREVSKYYAPDFIYKSPFRKGLNFEEYCQNLALVRAHTEFEVLSVENIQCCYEIMLGISIIHDKTRRRSKLTAKAECYFEASLIQKINVKYKATPLQAAYILKNTLPFSRNK